MLVKYDKSLTCCLLFQKPVFHWLAQTCPVSTLCELNAIYHSPAREGHSHSEFTGPSVTSLRHVTGTDLWRHAHMQQCYKAEAPTLTAVAVFGVVLVSSLSDSFLVT